MTDVHSIMTTLSSMNEYAAQRHFGELLPDVNDIIHKLEHDEYRRHELTNFVTIHRNRRFEEPQAAVKDLLLTACSALSALPLHQALITLAASKPLHSGLTMLSRGYSTRCPKPQHEEACPGGHDCLFSGQDHRELQQSLGKAKQELLTHLANGDLQTSLPRLTDGEKTAVERIEEDWKTETRRLSAPYAAFVQGITDIKLQYNKLAPVRFDPSSLATSQGEMPGEPSLPSLSSLGLPGCNPGPPPYYSRP